MNDGDISTAYDSLAREARARVLARLARELTALLRGLYRDDPQLVSARLPSAVYEINEIQHGILGLLLIVLSASEQDVAGPAI